MKIKDLPQGTAIVVKPTGLIDLMDGDSVLVGVKCVFKDGKFYPTCRRLSLVKDIFDDPPSDDLIILKREKDATPI